MVSEIQNTIVDPNWIMAIIAFCAIISPIITAIIDNICKAKNQRLEIYELAKRQALSDYIESSHKVATTHTPENEAKFYIALNKLFLFFPDLPKDDFRKLSEIYSDSEDQSLCSYELIEKLSKQIKKN